MYLSFLLFLWWGSSFSGDRTIWASAFVVRHHHHPCQPGSIHHGIHMLQHDDTPTQRPASLPNASSIRDKQPNLQTSLTKLGVATMLALTVLTAGTEHAFAGFGPSSGATTSVTPGLSDPKVQEQDIQKQRKLQQIIGSTIDERRLAQFSEQLDTVIDGIRIRQGQNSVEEESVENNKNNNDVDNELLDEVEALRNQIYQREQLLEKLEAQPYWFNYLAAFIGSVASTLVMHPIDSIKTRLQVHPSSDDDTSEPPIWNQNTTDDSYIAGSSYLPVVADDSIQTDLSTERNVDSSTTTMVQERLVHSVESVHVATVYDASSTVEHIPLLSGLYKGLAGNIAKEGPPSALYLGVYETAKLQLSAQFPRPEYLLGVYLISGALGELVGSIIRAPAEAVKTVVQASELTTSQAAQQVLGTLKGRENVVRAWSASIWRDVPFGAIQLAIFELVKAYILNNPDIVDFDSSTLSAEAIIGAFAGACGAFLTTPADVVTTRIITQGETGTLGVMQMARKIYEEGGMAAFFSGWQARVGYWAPSISIFLTCYCSVRQAGVRFDLFG